MLDNRELSQQLLLNSFSFSDYKWYLFTVIIIEALIFFIWCAFFSPLLIIMILLGLVLISWSFFSITRTLSLMLVYSTVLPQEVYSISYMPVYVSHNIIFLLFIIAIGYFVFYILYNKIVILNITIFDIAFLLFMSWLLYSTFLGIKNHNSLHFIKKEFIVVVLYGTYFLVTHVKIKKEWFYAFFKLIVFVSIIASFEFLIESILIRKSISMRITSQQIHLALLSIPYLIMRFLHEKNTFFKFLFITLTLPIFYMVMVSQTRMLWGSIVLCMFLIIMIFLYIEKATWSRILKFIFVYLLFIVVILFAYKGLSIVSGTEIDESLGERIQTIENLQYDTSLIVRVSEIVQALSSTNIFFGNGLGDVVVQYLRSGATVNYIDNAYAWLVWKMGIIGLLFFLLIMIIFFQRSLVLFKKNMNSLDKILVAVSFVSIVCLLFVALTNTCIILYRYNLIYAIMMGYVEIIYREN